MAIKYTVEANSFEHHMLYFANQLDYEWVSATSGDGINIGTLDDRPIFISRLIDTINGKEVLFWYPTSVVIDYDQVEAWLEDTYTSALRVDADNFYRILKELKDE